MDWLQRLTRAWRRWRQMRAERVQRPGMCTRLPVFTVRILVTVVGVIGLGWGPVSGREPVETVDFDREIRPLLADNCFQCHGPDERARKSKLRLDRREGVLSQVAPGRPGTSTLLERIASSDPDHRMPPPGTGRTLTPGQVARVRIWISQGARWTRHWSLRPIRRATVPAAIPGVGGRSRNAIDHFVQAQLNRHGLVASEPSGRARLVRRVTLALTGLPPQPGLVAAAVADSGADWYERLVDRLLGSPRFGEHLARHWLDLARYADTDGYQDDEPRVMWRWRDWVVDTINDNMPFDRFTVEQLAGDLLARARPEQVLATGFNRNNRTNGEGGSIAEEFRVEYIIDRLDTLSTTWMGLTLACARCHDHKYDPLSQRDFYRLFAFFNNIPEKGTYRRNAPPLVKVPTSVVAGELADLARQIAALTNSVKARQALEVRRTELLKTVPSTMVLQEGPRRDTFILVRGRYDRHGEKVTAGVPESLPEMDAGLPRNRLGLARWLVSDRHPLTARVAVNRVWQQLFGRGLVTTPEDFGSQGARPSHPALLDWLASEFREGGWDVKRLLRLIVTSHTFRQSSKVRPVDLKLDPDNRWLARAPRLRLSAETIRDQALAASGMIVEQLGGPSVKPHQPAGLWKEIAGGASGVYKNGYQADRGTGLYRRSLYTFWRRTIPPPMMATFDAPSREACSVRRGRTNTPLQALALMNDTLFVEAARRLADRVAAGSEVSDRIDSAFAHVLGRRPTAMERRLLMASYLRSLARFSKRPGLGKELLAAGGVGLHDPEGVAARASLVTTCHVILNLDEVVTRE